MPILIIFRALGLTADKDILQYVVYDFGDTAMMEALRPSLEEAFPIQSQEVTVSLASSVLSFTQKPSPSSPRRRHSYVPLIIVIRVYHLWCTNASCVLSVSQKSLGAEDAASASQGHRQSLHAASFQRRILR